MGEWHGTPRAGPTAGQAQAIPSSFEPPKPAEPPDPPPFLAGYALAEWRRVAPGLHVFGLLAEADVMPLSAYSTAYARWRTALEKVEIMADRDPVMAGLIVKTQSGGAAPNPLVQIADRAARDMVRYASEFGFSPAARSRIAAGIGGFGSPQRGKFDGLLAGEDDGAG